MIRRLLALLAIMLAVSASAVAFAGPASAHATLESTSPVADEVVAQPPTEVVLRFDEAVDASIGGVQIYGPDGTAIATGAPRRADAGLTVRVPVTLTARGTYTVSWRVASDDGHTIAGSFVFHHVEKSGSGADIGGSGRWASYLAWLSRSLVFGGAMVCIGTMVLAVATARRDDQRVATLAWWGSGAALIGSIGIIWSRASQVSGKPVLSAFSVIGELVQTSRAGTLDAVRIGLALVALVAAMSWGRGRLVALPAMAAVLVTFSLSGHAWTSSPVGLTVTVDAIHLLAAATWAGGLVALAVLVRGVDDPRPLVRRFSDLAAVGLVIVATSGAVSSLVHVDSWTSLWHTAYGRLLAAKVIVVAVMALLGAMHRRTIARGIELATRHLRTIGAEALLGAVVVGVTAGLVFTAPAIDSRARPYSAVHSTEVGQIRLQIQPAHVGLNDLRITFESADGAPRSVDAAEVTVGTETIPSRKLDVTVDDPSRVTASGASLATPGKWMVTVVGVTRGVSETSTFEVVLR